MPSRIIRESARTSPTLDALSAEEERLFWRLVTVCDDHGRFIADPRVVLATAFPLKVATLTPEIVEGWLQGLVRVGAIRLYTIEGRSYACFTAWLKHQRRPQSVSKFPAPPEEEDGASTVVPPRPHGEAAENGSLLRDSRSRNRESGVAVEKDREAKSFVIHKQTTRQGLEHIGQVLPRVRQGLPKEA